jgi:hypothetical protein
MALIETGKQTSAQLVLQILNIFSQKFKYQCSKHITTCTNFIQKFKHLHYKCQSVSKTDGQKSIGRWSWVRVGRSGSGSGCRGQGQGSRVGVRVGVPRSARRCRACLVATSGSGRPPRSGRPVGRVGSLGRRRAADSEIWLGGARVGGGRRRATDSEIWLGRSTGGCAREIWLGTGRVSHIRA